MWGAIIGAALGLGSMGINAISGASESRKRRAELERQERENQAWYDRRYNEAGRERASARRALEALAEAQRERQAGIHGRRSVMGGTTAVSAAESAEANKAQGSLRGQLDAQQEARADAIEKQYMDTKKALRNIRYNASLAQSRNTANAASQAASIGASIAAGLDGGKSSSTSSRSGQSAVSGGTTASQVGWNAPMVASVKPGVVTSFKPATKVVTAPDPYNDREEWLKQFNKDYYDRMYSIW